MRRDVTTWESRGAALFVALTGLLLAGCENSHEDKVREGIAGSMRQAKEDVQKGLDKAAGEIQKQLGAAQKSLTEEGQRASALVDAADLKGWLPERFAGLRRSGHEARTTEFLGLGVARAEASFGDGAKTATIELTDLGKPGASVIAARYTWLDTSVDREDAQGIEKTTTWGGERVSIEYDKTNQEGEIQLVVEKRILVQVESRGVSFEALERAAKGLDTKALRKLIE